ncbi:D-alanyl-lipoteichoic acid biosynthesis protein DltB [Weissella paramesenteroides]|uniref:D-alanyl-lipoteichoic acid biosynthesis protein DltB n=1 Tax=Weissella paramesenteroides TaxID=1249 RepID=UPI00123A4A0A|nr:D-alanyl-lipoteichoic acid biosynthesis protein DltB [Weissella paramesenteroides]KAA8455579.1 D-alanyl-lipoteichoic acid biosynthesis protein DltB [Weissella paramesenteroides]KAA8456835.1 D-alanyl-lipoteichoic acid biosynthesis protein DltB [Weissella paramesenteroides]KAA8458368.1 D-alanyl-lipoteichoic acid biosynthesis protein DltB [Weissella paramesenteroides]KAA8459660.1 D-alanyl-lipoteichoic acid biosynthesis protein DltB [Weissella paramesenteroides]KAA8462670.1 D-alanyl-lipoteichoi
MMDWLQALPNLQPYGDPQYFVYLIILLVPIVIAILFGKRLKWYESLISLIFIVLMFAGDRWQQFIALCGYMIWQLIVVFSYASYRKKADNKWIFYGAVFLDILPLTIVKLTPALTMGKNSMIGFLGISYLMFRSVGMLMETRDGVLKEFTLSQFLRFMLFMPTISSGPIDRFRRFTTDYEQLPDRAKYLNMLERAVHYLFLGFLYKFILAYVFASLLLPNIKHMALAEGGLINLPTIGVMYVYGLDLFFDFAGYSLFAIAISYIMGIETPINFNKPFLAKNLKDFWNRWHMSLSFWFRDFVFMRLVMVFMRHKVFKNRNVTSGVVYVLNMTIMGFWHGVTWYYISYGIFHGLGLVINDWWLRYKRRHKDQIPHNKFTEVFAIFITFNVVMFSFLLFSGFLDQLWFHNY